MPRFFIERADIEGRELVTLAGENGRHAVKSLRVRPGEKLILCDGAGTDYLCEALEAQGEELRLKVLERSPNESEPGLSLTLYQCIPKGDKLEEIAQKAVELGAARLVPVESARCVSRPDEKAKSKRTARLNRIMLEAAKQSGRGIVPAAEEPMSFEKAVSRACSEGEAILFYEEGGAPIEEAICATGKKIAVFIGPEGGFDEKEVRLAERLGARIATLGKRILRTETAPIAAIAIIMALRGEME